MQNVDTFQFRGPQSFCCLFVIFLLIMTLGCSLKDSAIAFLKSKNVSATSDSFNLYAVKGDLAMVILQDTLGVDVNSEDNQKHNAPTGAAWRGKENLISYLIEAKANVNLVNQAGLTPFGTAISQKQTAIALALLEQAANLNIDVSGGSSPLIEAVWQVNILLVNARLSKGVNPNYKNSSSNLSALKSASAK